MDRQRRNGVISFASCSLNVGVDHDHVTNNIVGGDKSHRLSSLLQMFEGLVNNVKSAKLSEDSTENAVSDAAVNTNSILDELKLAQEHLVFKWLPVDPDVKCSEIVTSINGKKVTPQLAASVLGRLRDTLPIYGLHLRFATAYAVGLTWKAFDLMVEHPVSKMIPSELRSKYPLIDYAVKIMHECPVSGSLIVLLPDMPHLVKCI